jgi:hypothetical protein
MLLGLLLGWLVSAPAAPPQPTEYEVKAAFLFNMAQFVEWPREPRPTGAQTLDVCVYGDDPFGPALNALQGKAVAERTVRVRRVRAVAETGACRMLFVSHSAQADVERVVGAVGTKGVLTLGDSSGFAQRGVVVNFYLEDDRVRFEINPRAAARAGLTISSRLLHLARIVGEP